MSHSLLSLAMFGWQPACGGLEQEYTCKGKKYLYMWNHVTNEHATYCVTDDLFLSDQDYLDLVRGVAV